MNELSKFERAIAAIDAANAQDPHSEIVEGKPVPKELAYSRRMSAWLERLAPDASEALRLAARAQHIERWTIPRDTYPRDRKGYKLWRFELGKYHARRTGEILQEVGYDDATTERVGELLRKEKLRSDPDVQMLEDVICVVFLESYLADFSEQHDDEKVVDILRKTWVKMTPRGHEAALGLEMAPKTRELVERALA